MVNPLARTRPDKSRFILSHSYRLFQKRFFTETFRAQDEVADTQQVRIRHYLALNRPHDHEIPKRQSQGHNDTSRNTGTSTYKYGVQLRNGNRRKTQTARKVIEDSGPLQTVLPHPSASIILRDACKCSKCKDSSTTQREFNVANVPTDIKPSKIAKSVQGELQIQWANDMPGWEDHTSTFSQHEISRLANYMRDEHRLSVHLWDNKEYTNNRVSVNYDDYMKSDVVLAKTLYNFARYGLVFIKDVPEDEKSIKRLAKRIGVIKSTFYGKTWDVRSVPEAKNVAYTNGYLGFHSDLLYLKEPPTVQYLHCLHNTAEGGESRFVDQFKAMEVLYKEHKDLALILRDTELRYEYENDGYYYTDIKPIIQLRTHDYQFPKRSMRGSDGFGALGHVHRMYWSPQFLGSILVDKSQSRKDIEQSLVAMKKYTEILERKELIYEEKLQPGTCVMFDNLRVLHGRNQFDLKTGKRWLRGTYLDGQELWSMEMKLKDYMREFAREERLAAKASTVSKGSEHKS